MAFVFFEGWTKIDHVIRENKNEDENNGLS
jgi:hypothetical protein